MLFKYGNKKLSKDTLIFNMGTSTYCPSKKLKLCNHPKKCYGLKAEKMFPNTLPYRIKQSILWNMLTAEQIAETFKKSISRRRLTTKYIRFNESGDFNSQIDIEKLKEIANLIPDITIYGYTHRKDLNFNKLPDNLIINGSGFMVDNNFAATDQPTGTVCPTDCQKCTLCKTKGKKLIEVKYH